MNRFLFCALLLLITFTISIAQKNTGGKYDVYWKNIRLASNDENPYQSDTMLVMYSTRDLHETELFFFNHKVDPNGKVTILLAVCKNQQWKMFIMPNLDSAMSFMPVKKDLVFYIEGLGKNYPIAMYRAAGLTTQYNVNVIMFDYPTLDESKGLIGNFYFAQKSSRNSAPAIAKFLTEVNEYDFIKRPWVNGKNKTLFIHSMGNVMLRAAMKEGLFKPLPINFIDRLILNAACVNQKNHAHWIDAIHFSEEIYIHHNKKDFELLGARILTHRLKLGAKPKKTFSQKAIYVNFTNVLGSQHNAYLNKPGMINIPQSSSEYYNQLLHGNKDIFTNTLLFQQGEQHNHFILK